MKRIKCKYIWWNIFMTFCILCLSACGNSQNETASNALSEDLKERSEAPLTENETEMQEENVETTNKSSEEILIAYFSRSGNTENYPDGIDAVSTASLIEKNGTMFGNTEYLASLIQQSVGGDLFLIEVEEPYPTEYDETVNRAEKENRDQIYPILNSHIGNPENYQYIFVGFPNWWYDMPMAVYSFFEENDFSGKTIIPFCTSGGSRFSKSISKIEELEPGAVTINNGFTVSHFDIEECTLEEVDSWISELGIDFSK